VKCISILIVFIANRSLCGGERYFRLIKILFEIIYKDTVIIKLPVAISAVYTGRGGGE
jgi:hypothetical protein